MLKRALLPLPASQQQALFNRLRLIRRATLLLSPMEERRPINILPVAHRRLTLPLWTEEQRPPNRALRLLLSEMEEQDRASVSMPWVDQTVLAVQPAEKQEQPPVNRLLLVRTAPLLL
jgi:hypothetical protein